MGKPGKYEQLLLENIYENLNTDNLYVEIYKQKTFMSYVSKTLQIK